MEAAKARRGGEGQKQKRRKEIPAEERQSAARRKTSEVSVPKAAIFTSPSSSMSETDPSSSSSKKSLRRRDWASLPGDILGIIFRRLTLLDAIRSAAACMQWWLAAVESRDPELPWIWKKGSREFYSISDDRVYSLDLPEEIVRRNCYCIGSHEGWMVLQEDRNGNRKGRCFLFNPFSATRIQLPKISVDGSWSSNKIVLSSSPKSPHCVAALLVRAVDRVGFSRMDDKESEWTMLPEEEKYKDIVFHNQSLYVVTDKGELKLVEISCLSNAPFQVRTVLPPPSHPYFKSAYELMECGGELLMVHIVFDSPMRFLAFCAKLEFQRWEMVESLGGQAIVHGIDFYTTIRATKLVGVEEDCIHFLRSSDCEFIFRVSEKRYETKFDTTSRRCPFPHLKPCLTPISWRNSH